VNPAFAVWASNRFKVRSPKSIRLCSLGQQRFEVRSPKSISLGQLLLNNFGV
jgi:hypothetical protein